MIGSFFIAPDGMSLDEVQLRVRDQQLTLGIVKDQDGRLAQVVGPHGPAPLLVAGRDTPLRAVLDLELLMERINAGAPGVVVLEGQQPVGVVDADILRDYLLNEYVASGTTLGDATLPGSYVQPRLVIKCACCGAANEVDDLVIGRTMCVNGHALCVDWG